MSLKTTIKIQKGPTSEDLRRIRQSLRGSGIAGLMDQQQIHWEYLMNNLANLSPDKLAAQMGAQAAQIIDQEILSALSGPGQKPNKS